MFKAACLLVCLLCGVVKVSGMSEEMQELIDQLHNTCTAESGTTDDLIVNARKGDFSEDEKFKCYFKCLFDQMAVMTDDGKVDAEAVVALMPPEIQDKIAPTVRKCTEVGANPCETAWLANRCYQKGAPDVSPAQVQLKTLNAQGVFGVLLGSNALSTM